jgi:putative glutamine amidotransferase
MTTKKPLIGIPLDSIDPAEETDGKWYSELSWYALRHRYCEAISHAGGIPLPLPYHFECLDDYCNLIDGLLLTGGGFDIEPSFYGADYHHPKVTPLRPKRTAFESVIAKTVLKANKPVLGICAGMQLLNVIHGGTLIQDIPDEAPSPIDHKQKQVRTKHQHEVEILQDTLLRKLVKGDLFQVNSIHHQAVKKLSDCFQVNARAPDGLIEGIESSQYRFCIGVQWHPEFHVSSADIELLKGFVKACE